MCHHCVFILVFYLYFPLHCVLHTFAAAYRPTFVMCEYELKIYKPRLQLDVWKYFFQLGLLMNGIVYLGQ